MNHNGEHIPEGKLDRSLAQHLISHRGREIPGPPENTTVDIAKQLAAASCKNEGDAAVWLQ
jgi:hypothetical protein